MKKLSLFLFDLIFLSGALVLTLLIRYSSNTRDQINLHIGPFSIVFIIFIVVFYVANLYESRELRNSAKFYSLLLRSILVAAVIAIAFFYLAPKLAITPKTNLFIFLLIFTLLESGNRWLSNSVFEKTMKRATVILGVGDNSIELARLLRDNPQLGHQFKYMADINPDHLNRNNPKYENYGIIEGLPNLIRILTEEKIDTVVVSSEVYKSPQLLQALYESLGRGVSFENLSSFYEKLTGKVLIGGIDQAWFLENITNRTKLYQSISRILDVVLSLVGGVVSLIFYPLIIILILVFSPGPIFYKQRRVGRRGESFNIIKFRTMSINAESETGAIWAQDNDPRVTRIGRFLRSTRLDELPQLWNILRGDMSFVGPRAERPEFHTMLGEKIPFYDARYLVRPGLTGWAQINFRYGSSIEDSAEKLKYDLYYIKNRSILFDFGIMLKTARIALSQAGK